MKFYHIIENYFGHELIFIFFIIIALDTLIKIRKSEMKSFLVQRCMFHIKDEDPKLIRYSLQSCYLGKKYQRAEQSLTSFFLFASGSFSRI